MDTLGFLQAVLPDAPIYYIAKLIKQDGKEFFVHKAVTSLPQMARLVTYLDGVIAPTEQIYFACSAYKEPHITITRNGEDRRAYRLDANWYGAKALWVDIDVKPENPNCYGTIREAFAELRNKVGEYELPTPLVVKSGNGLHAYWLLDRTVTNLAEWKSYAELLKSVLQGAGLKFDTPKTVDPKAVLRPVGTTHRKNIAAPKEVRLLKESLVGQVVNLDHFIVNLKDTAHRNGFTYTVVSEFDLMDVPAYARGDPAQLVARMPRVAVLDGIKEGCQQIRAFTQAHGKDVDYPIWFRVLGLFKHVENGYELGKMYSSGDERYSEEVFDKAWNAWSTGPTSCAEFNKHNPDGCSGCVYKAQGRITNPIVLGFVHKAEPVIEAKNDTRMGDTTPTLLPQYKFQGGKMWHLWKDPETKEEVAQSFCDGFLYGLGRERGAKSEFETVWRLIPPHKDDPAVEFNIPSWMLNSKKDLLKALGTHEIILNESEYVHMVAYLRDTVRHLRDTAKAKSSRTKFGWQPEGSFLYGNELYTEDGQVTQVNLAPNLSTFTQTFFTPPSGSIDDYLNALHKVYSRPMMEPYQYTICSAYGSLLNSLVGDSYNGLVLTVAGANSGRGKTTVCKAAMYGFGSTSNASSCMITGDGQGQGATVNARVLMLATLANFPLILDEFSKQNPDELRQLCYEIANGSSKAYATKDRALVAGLTFQMSPIMTGNGNFQEALQSGKQKAAAESVRMLQIYIDSYATFDFIGAGLGHDYVGKQEREMACNTGWVGREFAKYIVTHKAEVKESLNKFIAQTGGVIDNPALRFYRYHVACTLTAAEVLIEKLQLFKFDFAILSKFAIKLLVTNAQNVMNMVVTDWCDVFCSMVNELSGRMYHTRDYADSRQGHPESVPIYREPAVGRYVYGSPTMVAKDMEGKMILSAKAISDYCTANNIDRKALMEWAYRKQVLVRDKEEQHSRYDLARGTTAPRQMVRAYLFNMNAAVLDDANLPKPMPLPKVEP